MKEKIKNIRKNLGLSQEDFGKLLLVTRAAVNYWEKGVSIPNKLHCSYINELENVSVVGVKDAIRINGVSGGQYLIWRNKYDGK